MTQVMGNATPQQVTGPCEFLVMYDLNSYLHKARAVTGPCEFLVMYDKFR